MKKQIMSGTKVVCRGNARRFGLRPSGRRNALGSILTKRLCKWRSGCSPTMALIFRCNTHTAPNFRVPITVETHDPDCKLDCLGQDKARLLTAITYRAQRSTAGYFAGYISKRQGVGRFELAQATKNLEWLKEKLQGKSNVHQYRAVLKKDKDSKYQITLRWLLASLSLLHLLRHFIFRTSEIHRTFWPLRLTPLPLPLRLTLSSQNIRISGYRSSLKPLRAIS